MVEAVSACRAPRDAIAAGVEQQQVVFTRDAASRPAPSTTRSGGRTSSGCVAEASDGARCPFLARSYLGLRRRPAASCGCPAVLKVKRRALGGFSRVLAAFLVSLVTSTCTFLKPIFNKRARSNLCGTPLDVVLARVRSGMRAGAGFKKLVGLSTLDNIESSHEYVRDIELGA